MTAAIDEVRASTTDAEAICGATFRAIDYWVRQGHRSIGPSIAESKGSGSHRVFSWADLLALRTIVVLREWGRPATRSDGVTLDVCDAAATIVRTNAERLDYHLDDCLAIDAAGQVHPGPSWPATGAPYLVVPIAPIVDYVAAGVEMRLGLEIDTV